MRCTHGSTMASTPLHSEYTSKQDKNAWSVQMLQMTARMLGVVADLGAKPQCCASPLLCSYSYSKETSPMPVTKRTENNRKTSSGSSVEVLNMHFDKGLYF